MSEDYKIASRRVGVSFTLKELEQEETEKTEKEITLCFLCFLLFSSIRLGYLFG
jgi:hypothetical protein